MGDFAGSPPGWRTPLRLQVGEAGPRVEQKTHGQIGCGSPRTRTLAIRRMGSVPTARQNRQSFSESPRSSRLRQNLKSGNELVASNDGSPTLGNAADPIGSDDLGVSFVGIQPRAVPVA